MVMGGVGGEGKSFVIPARGRPSVRTHLPKRNLKTGYFLLDQGGTNIGRQLTEVFRNQPMAARLLHHHPKKAIPLLPVHLHVFRA